MCVRRKIFSHLDRRTRTKTLIYFNFFYRRRVRYRSSAHSLGKRVIQQKCIVVGRFFSTPTKDRRFLHVCLRTAFSLLFFPVKKREKKHHQASLWSCSSFPLFLFPLLLSKLRQPRKRKGKKKKEGRSEAKRRRKSKVKHSPFIKHFFTCRFKKIMQHHVFLFLSVKCLANSILLGERGKEWQNGRKGGRDETQKSKALSEEGKEEGWREREG